MSAEQIVALCIVVPVWIFVTYWLYVFEREARRLDG